MPKHLPYTIAIVAVTIAAVVGGAFYLLGGFATNSPREIAVDKVLAAYTASAPQSGGVSIAYPRNETLFPPEIAPPTFQWTDSHPDANGWVVLVDTGAADANMAFASLEPTWRPAESDWEEIKKHSTDAPARVTILGIQCESPQTILSSASIEIQTSSDPVDGSLFYREVNLPFAEAVKDPGSHIRWRYGSVASREPPPIVLENVPNCANCHSFSADGATLAMEIDSANDKGSYAIVPVEEEIVIEPSKIITWSDYRREDEQPTFGLLPQISPDGRYVVCMVKDQSVFLAKEGLAFSQIFFPIKGILVYYDRQTKSFHPLPGAGDQQYVHANPTWSPDGKYIVFARAEVHQSKRVLDVRSSRTSGLALLNQPQSEQFLKEVGTYQYDLYRIPFNDGKGGTAEPIEGASQNGRSNYFAKFSPDGKWIVFCQANSFMLLQEDSELFIIPSEGGEPRRMRCNTPRMNSWHSWSPNGKWLVFSSKWGTPYTQLYLTHIDENGRSTPPVRLENFTEPTRAANIPEFVNAPATAIQKIVPDYLDDTYYVRSGGEFRRQMDFVHAIPRYEAALQINPKNVDALVELGDTFLRLGRVKEAEQNFQRALEVDPSEPRAHEGMARIAGERTDFAAAREHLETAVRADPKSASARLRLGVLLMDNGHLEAAREHLASAAQLDPADPQAFCFLGLVTAEMGDRESAIGPLRRAVTLDPDYFMATLSLASLLASDPDATAQQRSEAVELATRACELTEDRDPRALVALAQACAAAGRREQALAAAAKAKALAQENGDPSMVQAIQRAVEAL